MYKLLTGILFVLILNGCASSETYKSIIALKKAGRIGFIDLRQDSLPTEIYTKVNSAFIETTPKAFKRNDIHSIVYQKEEAFKNDSLKNQIRYFCEKNNLDALILSKIRFLNVTYHYTVLLAIEIGSEDEFGSIIEMELYDKKGNLLVSASYDSHRKGYFSQPDLTTTVEVATEGAASQIVDKIYGYKKR